MALRERSFKRTTAEIDVLSACAAMLDQDNPDPEPLGGLLEACGILIKKVRH